jgi:phosphoglycerol transferase MdoB-like AlkP superfamily enzyme
MPDLTLQNIERVSNDILKEEIVFSHLSEELIDHLCCDIEYEMQSGIDFEKAYDKVRFKIGSRRLKEIQEETLYAVDTKYRHMKNTMKISAITGTVLLGFASLFKIHHWPSAGIMMTLGAICLALIFLPSALGVLWKETKSGKRIFLFISAFLAGMFFILGILFKVQHWPGGGVILSLSYLSGVIFFIPALFFSLFRDTERRAKRPAYILAFIGVTVHMLGLLFKIQHWPYSGLLLTTGMSILFVIALPLYTWIKWKDEKYVKAEYIYLLIGSLAILIPSVLISIMNQ